MALIGISFVAVLIGVFAMFMRWRLYKHWEGRRPSMPIALREWMLILSPAACAVALCMLFLILPIEQAGIDLTAAFLDLVCTGPRLIPWCHLPKPLTAIAAIQVAAWLVFLVSSLVLVRRIVFGAYQRPPNYDQRSTSPLGIWGVAAVWLLLLFGGQVYVALGGALTPIGLLFSTLALVFGVMCARVACLRIRFRKPAESGR